MSNPRIQKQALNFLNAFTQKGSAYENHFAVKFY